MVSHTHPPIPNPPHTFPWLHVIPCQLIHYYYHLVRMVNRSPTSNFQFRHCHIRNMAPSPPGGKNSKGKQLKNKATPGSANPAVRAKRMVNCSKCKTPHFPPTGRACQKVVTSTNPNPNLSSTLVHAEQESHGDNTRQQTSPTLSPVRTESPVRLEPNTQAAEAQMIQNLLDRFGQNTQSTTIPPHLAHASPIVSPVTHQPPTSSTHRVQVPSLLPSHMTRKPMITLSGQQAYSSSYWQIKKSSLLGMTI